MHHSLAFLATSAVASLLATDLVLGQGQGQGGRRNMDPLTLTCVETTRVTIRIRVQAGSTTGAPAGFSLQWMPLPANVTCANFVWPESDALHLCKASFSGTPGCSIYDLPPGGSIVVEVGNLNDAECGVGLSNCGAEELACGTEYVFRAFAHANSSFKRGPNTANLCCSTQAYGGCTLTQGYWKTHACDWPLPFVPGAPATAPTTQCLLSGPSSSCAADAVTTMPVGTNAYTQGQLLCFFALSGQGNALRILGHQLVAAQLNVLNGAAVPAEIVLAIDTANTLIGSLPLLTGVVATGGPGNTLGPAMRPPASGGGCGGGTDVLMAEAERCLDEHGREAWRVLRARIESVLIRAALRRTTGNRAWAARLLGISRPTLREKAQRHGLQGDQQREA